MKSGEYNVDSLFREKLEGYEPELSDYAVDRMNRIISGERNNLIFRRIAVAAGISLVLASTVLLIRSRYIQSQENIVSVAEQSTVQPREFDDATESISGIKSPQTASKDDGENNTIAVENTKESIPPAINNYTATNDAVIVSSEEPEELLARDVLMVEPIGKKTMAAGDPVKPSGLAGITAGSLQLIEGNDRPGRVVIEYISNPDSNPREQGKSTPFAGIIEKANEIRNEVTLGNLRDAKDQLFALEFIKSRNNNSNSK